MPMEYYAGETLKKKVEQGPMSVDTAIDIGMQVAQGLAEAHEKGIVHRDIKPANLMITNDQVVKIVDFGLGKLSGATKLTKAGTTLGTTAYMSPEQASGKDTDNRTDIWSLGVVLYQMVTGQMPFRGESDQAVMLAIRHDPHQPITGLRTGFPLEFERRVNKCLEKNPSDRYQQVNELIVDLRRLKKESESQATVSRAALNAVGQRKGRAFALPGVIMVGMILAVIGYFFVFGEKAESAERIPIAVADFVNETKEEELNSLSGILITALEQSRRLSVLTRSRMFDVLKQLGKEEVEYIDEQLGIQICKKANVEALVIASIRKLGQRYVVDLKVLDPQKDEYLLTVKEEGEGQESISSMIDEPSEKTRIGLREKTEEIQASRQRVAQATTSNLVAYQHYFKGEELVNKLKF